MKKYLDKDRLYKSGPHTKHKRVGLPLCFQKHQGTTSIGFLTMYLPIVWGLLICLYYVFQSETLKLVLWYESQPLIVSIIIIEEILVTPTSYTSMESTG